MFVTLVVCYVVFEGYFCVYALYVSESVNDWLNDCNAPVHLATIVSV